MKLVKGRLGEIKFQLNPSKIDYNGGREWFNITSAGMRPIPVSGSYKARTLSFELIFTNRAFIEVDMQDVFDKLLKYRMSANSVPFVFGGAFAEEVYVIDCPMSIEAFSSGLNVHELKVPIVLQIKEQLEV